MADKDRTMIVNIHLNQKTVAIKISEPELSDSGYLASILDDVMLRNGLKKEAKSYIQAYILDHLNKHHRDHYPSAEKSNTPKQKQNTPNKQTSHGISGIRRTVTKLKKQSMDLKERLNKANSKIYSRADSGNRHDQNSQLSQRLAKIDKDKIHDICDEHRSRILREKSIYNTEENEQVTLQAETGRCGGETSSSPTQTNELTQPTLKSYSLFDLQLQMEKQVQLLKFSKRLKAVEPELCNLYHRFRENRTWDGLNLSDETKEGLKELSALMKEDGLENRRLEWAEFLGAVKKYQPVKLIGSLG